jgi:hypothetical protein
MDQGARRVMRQACPLPYALRIGASATVVRVVAIVNEFQICA